MSVRDIPVVGRFIPTPVGNARPARPGTGRCAVHPHARGERSRSAVQIRGCPGSSPRPWGTPGPCRPAGSTVRFIPTPVGNAGQAVGDSGTNPVHPHARGERQFSQRPVSPIIGSSPRPWGTPAQRQAVQRLVRFIPTPVGNAPGSLSRDRRQPVHPHARGERVGAETRPRNVAGSSPRPWGTRRSGRPVDSMHRFIPTPVGNASRSSPTSAPSPVHPHARGERRRTCLTIGAVSGSSPRPWGTPPAAVMVGMVFPVHPHARGERALADEQDKARLGSSPRPWGTRRGRKRRGHEQRFIPTPVGNAPRRSQRPCRRPVHPHARGERELRKAPGSGVDGSSPRPWGTLVRESDADSLLRFIPTPVGNAPHCATSLAAATVHPHARGERALRLGDGLPHGGSSPRPWGTQHVQGGRLARQRFIPTPVGNAWRRTRARRSRSVHPHARGERLNHSAEVSAHCGSSPRPWGTPRAPALQSVPLRFIPTPVGNALHVRPSRPGWSVHPHARGERASSSPGTASGVGSSPRPWGTRVPLARHCLRGRFIPTPVGNASPSPAPPAPATVHPHARGERLP